MALSTVIANAQLSSLDSPIKEVDSPPRTIEYPPAKLAPARREFQNENGPTLLPLTIHEEETTIRFEPTTPTKQPAPVTPSRTVPARKLRDFDAEFLLMTPPQKRRQQVPWTASGNDASLVPPRPSLSLCLSL